MQTASYIPKSIDGGEPVAQTPETVQEQEDRSAIAYYFWLACGDGEPRILYVNGRSRPFTDLIYLRSSLWLCREDLSHSQTNGTALEMITIHTESTQIHFGAV